MYVNRLPARTWNKLGMNESRIEIETAVRRITPNIKIPETENENISYQENFMSWDDESVSTSKVETNLGDAFNDFLNTQNIRYDVLSIKDNEMEKKPVILSFHVKKQEITANRCLIQVGHNSYIKVVFLYEGDALNSKTFMQQVKVDLQDKATLEIYMVQMFGREDKVYQDFGAKCCKDSNVTFIQLHLGGKNMYAGGVAKLLGDRSQFIMKTGYYLQQNQDLDLNYVARHLGKKTESSMHASGILHGHTQKIFRGTIDFVKGSSYAKGEETEDVLLLGDDVVNQSVPLILCGEENVEGSHGASIGRLDEQILFYLGSRGLSQEVAEKMIADAKLQAIYQRIPDEEIIQKIKQKIETLMEADYGKL